MLRVICLKVGELKSNCYLIFDEKTKETLIVDPGDEADFIEEKISQHGLTPKFILATHGHFDHILASLELKLAYSLPFLINKKDRFLITRADKTADYYSTSRGNLKVVSDDFIKDSDEIILGKEKLRVIESPGHTPGSISLYSSKNKLLFVGDLFFADGSIGRHDFKYSSKKELSSSIKRLLKLPDNVIVYCGHGPEIYLGEFRKIYEN